MIASSVPYKMQSLLRSTETIQQSAEATVIAAGKTKEGVAAVVRSKAAAHEQALFIFKKSRLLGKLKLFRVYPVTKELRLAPRPHGFQVSWCDESSDDLVLLCEDERLLDTLSQRLAEMSSYQREPFNAQASAYRWIWFYETYIPAIIGDIEAASISTRLSIGLKPEHYGKEAMLTYVQQQLLKREGEYVTTHYIPVFVGTWNCAGTGPDQSLVSWLSCASPEPDILILGLQEMCMLTATNILGDEGRMREWVEFVERQVKEAFPGSRYVKVDTGSLVGLLTILFVKDTLRSYVRVDPNQTVKLGFRGVTVGFT